MRFRILLGLVTGATLLVSAQSTRLPAGSRSLSLRECFDLALSRNLDLRIQHLTTDIAGYSLSSSWSPYEPLFSFGARHDYVSQPGDFDPQKFNPDFPYVMQNDTLGPALTGKAPIGLSYAFNAFTREDNARTDFTSDAGDAANFPGGIRSTNNYFSSVGVTLQQHLLKDFWIDADRELIQVRRKEVSMSKQALRFQVMKTMLAVELGYYDLVAAREYVQVQEKACELRRQFVAETRRRVEVGDLPPLDTEQAETQLQNSLTALAAAREALAARQNALKGLLTDNFRDWVDLEVEPSEALVAVPAAINRAESFQRALTERPDLIEARLAVERSDVTVKFRLNQLFPSLDFVGRYGGLGVDPEPGNSINNAISFRNQEYSYGVVLSVPLSNVGERGYYHASKASKQITELQLQKAEQDVLLQIADYLSRVETRFSQVGSTRKARMYAESALEAEVKKLANGFSTSFVVLELQEILTAARTAEVQALADYNKNLAQLAFAEGNTLERNHITLDVK